MSWRHFAGGKAVLNRRALISLATFALSAPEGPLAAQVRTTRPRGGITGVVRDSQSLRPVEKVWVCVSVEGMPSYSPRCVRVDSAGRYQLDSVPAQPRPVTVTCSGLRPRTGRYVGIDTVTVPDSGYVTHDWLVSTAGCDPRPVRRITRIFRGHFTAGFEESEFIPCPSDAWFIRGDSLEVYPYNARRAWATWPGSDMTKTVPHWPDVPIDKYFSRRYYVRWRGTVIGPGNYGHLGVSAFEFKIDSVLQVRAPTSRDCQ
jgi:hypothetical protein